MSFFLAEFLQGIRVKYSEPVLLQGVLMREKAAAIFLITFTVFLKCASSVWAANISIDAQDIVREVNHLVFGNAQDFGHGDFFLEKSTLSFEPEAVDLVSELRPTVLRFPGGCHADQYFWEDGIGPHHLRPDPRPGQYEHFGFDYGTDEHMELSAQVGAEALITVNYGSGIVGGCLSLSAPLVQRVARAADWVEYCNAPDDGSNPNGGVNWASRRAENGHPEPYGIRFWEIGNEIYFEGQIGNVDVHTYARDVIAFSRAMKAVDPSILIGAVGPSQPYWNRWWIPGSPEWNPTLLSVCHQHIDFLVVHCYYPGPNDVVGEDLYRAGMASADQALADLSEIRSIIDQYDTTIGIVPGENGFIAGIGDGWQRWELSTTLLAGLHLADLLMVFLEKDMMLNIPFACGWKLLSDTPNAEIGYHRPDGQLWIRPEYLVYQLYREHCGDFLVSNLLSCETFSTIEVAQVEEMSDVPELSVCTSIDSTGERLFLMVLNRQLHQDVQTSIQIDGFQPQPQANVWTLNGPSITSSNEQQPAVDIVPSTLDSIGGCFAFTFPAHSFTVIELPGCTQDTTNTDEDPPLLSGVEVSNITGSGACIRWLTDEPADSRVQYGTATGTYQHSVGNPTFTTQHEIILDSLISDRGYFFRVVSFDTSANEAVSEEKFFWTLDVIVPQIDQIQVSSITDSSATITWQTDEPADSRMEYKSVDGPSQNIIEGELVQEHHIDLTDLQPAMQYTYWISNADSAGNICDPQEGHFQTTSPRSAVSSQLSGDLPAEYCLYQNYPNPFNATTVIRYAVPRSGQVSVLIYNTMGQLVRTLVDQSQPPGQYQVSWDGKDDSQREVTSGIYFYGLRAGNYQDVCKMSLLR